MKNHPWFEKFNWVSYSVIKDDLLMKKVQAPYCIPQEKLVDLTKVKDKPTTVTEEFPVQPIKGSKLKKTRKDYDPNWDINF